MIQLLQFILNNLDQDDVKNVIYLTLLIDSFTVCLLLSAKNFRMQLIQDVQLDVTQEHLLRILDMIKKNHQLAQSKIFIKLLVNLIYLPFPYTNTEQTSLSMVLDTLHPIQDPFLFQLVSPLLLGSEEAITWANAHLSEWFDSLLIKLQDVVQTDSSIFHYFTCFDTVVRIPALKETIIGKNYHSTIYDMLKLENQS